ncbi:MAG: hypothetical protein ABI181_11430 [Mycobacteriaceae bacterium]
MGATPTARVAATAAALALFGVCLAPAASAATTVAHTVAVHHPVQGYANPGAQFTIALSVNLVPQGDRITVFVKGNVAGRVYDIRINSDPIELGTFTAGADGDTQTTFSTRTLDLGAHIATVTAVDTGEVQTAPFTVIGVRTGSSTQAGGSGSGLAFTGAGAVVPLLSLGVVLVGGGAAGLVLARRRKEHD